jgi:hypothetical protein
MKLPKYWKSKNKLAVLEPLQVNAWANPYGSLPVGLYCSCRGATLLLLVLRYGIEIW